MQENNENTEHQFTQQDENLFAKFLEYNKASQEYNKAFENLEIVQSKYSFLGDKLKAISSDKEIKRHVGFEMINESINNYLSSTEAFGERFEYCRLDNYKKNDSLVSKIKKNLMNNEWSHLLYGQAGAGKNHLAYCMASAFCLNYILGNKHANIDTICFVINENELHNLRINDYQGFIERVKNAKMIVINDIGMSGFDGFSEAKKSTLFDVLDCCYRDLKNIVLTTNINCNPSNTNSLSLFDTVGDTENRNARRIRELCGENIIEVKKVI